MLPETPQFPRLLRRQKRRKNRGWKNGFFLRKWPGQILSPVSWPQTIRLFRLNNFPRSWLVRFFLPFFRVPLFICVSPFSPATFLFFPYVVQLASLCPRYPLLVCVPPFYVRSSPFFSVPHPIFQRCPQFRIPALAWNNSGKLNASMAVFLFTSPAIPMIFPFSSPPFPRNQRNYSVPRRGPRKFHVSPSLGFHCILSGIFVTFCTQDGLLYARVCCSHTFFSRGEIKSRNKRAPWICLLFAISPQSLNPCRPSPPLLYRGSPRNRFCLLKHKYQYITRANSQENSPSCVDCIEVVPILSQFSNKHTRFSFFTLRNFHNNRVIVWRCSLLLLHIIPR